MFSQLLKKYRKKAGFTQINLGICVSQILNKEFSTSNIQGYESGKKANPKLEVIEALALILRIPVQYLFDDSEFALSQFSKNSVIQDIIKVPLLDGYVGAGSSGIIEDLKVTDYLYVDSHSINKTYKHKKIKALEVVGDSMSPYVDSADIILFTPLEKGQYHLTDGKYVIETMNGVMLKNLSFKTNGNIIISSCNKAYPPEEITAAESQEVLEIRGIVVGRILKS